MPWIWPQTVDAVNRGLRGYYGADFDAGIDRLTTMLDRRTPNAFGDRPQRETVANGDVVACAKTLIVLSDSVAFSVGVIAMVAALLPKSYLRELPGDVRELRGKMVYQRDRVRSSQERLGRDLLGREEE